MPSGSRLSTWAVLSMITLALNAHAESPWPAGSGNNGNGVQAHLTPLDDQALTAVQGMALDAVTMARLQTRLGPSRDDDKTARPYAEAARSAQTAVALTAALALQTNMAMRLGTTAVSSVNTATQIGGTLIALTPVTTIAPIGLPLFGLPSLPPKTSH